MSSFTVSKGTYIRKEAIVTIKFGPDKALNMYDVDPRYLNVYVAIGIADTMIHTGLIFKAHGEQIKAEWNSTRWTMVGVHMASSGLKVCLADSESSIQEDMKGVLGFSEFKTVSVGSCRSDVLEAAASVANTEVDKELKIDGPQGSTNCLLFAGKVLKALGLSSPSTMRRVREAIPASLRNSTRGQTMMQALGGA